MKNLLLALMCIAISFVTIASEKPQSKQLTVSGQFLTKKHVSYTVCRINSNMTYTTIKEAKGIISYSVELELGHTYIITFNKGKSEKTLYVKATEPGYKKLDINFRNTRCAELSWDIANEQYDIRLLSMPIYRLEDNRLALL